MALRRVKITVNFNSTLCAIRSTRCLLVRQNNVKIILYDRKNILVIKNKSVIGTAFNKRLALRRPFGRLRVPEIASRRLAPLWQFLPPHFASPGLAPQALIRAGKTSPTLNVMCHLLKNFEISIDKILKMLIIDTESNCFRQGAPVVIEMD